MKENICVLCNLSKTPEGTTVNGRFNCTSCNKEWILEKRKNDRFPKRINKMQVQDLLIEFLTIYDSELELLKLCNKTLSIIKNKFSIPRLGFQLNDNINFFLKFTNYISENPKSETFLTKLKISTRDLSHPFVDSLNSGNIEVRKIDTSVSSLMLYQKITKSKYQILFPVVYRSTTLGLICLDFDDKKSADRCIKHKDILALIIKEFSVALHHAILYHKTNSKYKQFVNLHASGLTLNKLYMNNTQEIFKMSLLTISGIVETDTNLFLVFNKKFKVLTSHKLIRTLTTFEFKQDSIIIENYEAYRHFFNKSGPELISSSKEKLSYDLGFSGREFLNLESFSIEVNEYVFLLGRTSTLLFTPDEVEVLSAYNELVKMTIENAYLYHKNTKQERLEKEVEIAKDIQLNLLPQKMPEHPFFDYAGVMEPAREIGGDYYDILVSPDNKETLFAIGDVSGKGLPAGMVMVTARTIIHSVIRRINTLFDIVKELNSYLYYNYKNSSTTRFMSLTCMIWKEETNKFQFAGGGHGNLLVYRKNSHSIEIVPTGGTILGIIPDIERTYNEGFIELEIGDSILLYTDGVTETLDRKGDMFEEDRLRDSLLRYSHLDAKGILSSIMEDLAVFSKNVLNQHDDTTMLIIKKK